MVSPFGAANMGSSTDSNNYFVGNRHRSALRQHRLRRVRVVASPAKGSGSASSLPGMKGVISDIYQVAASKALHTGWSSAPARSPCALAITLQRMGQPRLPRAALWNRTEGAGPAFLQRDQGRGSCRPCGVRPLLAPRTGSITLHVPKEASSASFQASAFPLKTGRPGLPLQREGDAKYAGAQSTGDKFLKKVKNEYVHRIHTHTLPMRVLDCIDR